MFNDLKDMIKKIREIYVNYPGLMGGVL